MLLLRNCGKNVLEMRRKVSVAKMFYRYSTSQANMSFIILSFIPIAPKCFAKCPKKINCNKLFINIFRVLVQGDL